MGVSHLPARVNFFFNSVTLLGWPNCGVDGRLNQVSPSCGEVDTLIICTTVGFLHVLFMCGKQFQTADFYMCLNCNQTRDNNNNYGQHTTNPPRIIVPMRGLRHTLVQPRRPVVATDNRIWINGIIFAEGFVGVVEAKPRHSAKKDVISARGREINDDIASDQIHPHDREVVNDETSVQPRWPVTDNKTWINGNIAAKSLEEGGFRAGTRASTGGGRWQSSEPRCYFSLRKHDSSRGILHIAHERGGVFCARILQEGQVEGAEPTVQLSHKAKEP